MVYYIILRGPLGVGKSTIAQKLSSILQGKCFEIDRILDDYNLTVDREEGYVSQKSFRRANKIILPKIKECLKHGIPVIVEGNFYWKSQIIDLINHLPFSHKTFTLRAPLSVCVQRDKNRVKSHGEDAACVVFEKSTEFLYGIDVDATKSLLEVIDEIVKKIPA